MKGVKMNLLALSLCMVAIALGAVFIGYNYGASATAARIPPSTPPPQPIDQPITTQPTEDEEIEPTEPELPFLPNGSISIPGFEVLTVQNGKLQADKIINPIQNECYFLVSVLLEGGTEIYRSGILAPNQSVGSVALILPLISGTYENAIVRYSCYDIETMQPLNGADIKFTLEVLS